MPELFSEDDRETFEAAMQGEPVALLAACECLLEHAKPLSPDGWMLHGGEILAVSMPLVDVADTAVKAGTVEVREAVYDDGSGEASDEALIANLGDGEIYRLAGRRWYRPRILVDVFGRLCRFREAQRRAGLFALRDADTGEWFYTTLPVGAADG